MEPIFHYQFRMILIGDSTVGKSSLLKCFTEGQFTEFCDPTVGVDFYAKIIEIPPGLRIKLQLWDTAGQEKISIPIKSITKSYYRNSVGVILVYDITNRKSFEHVASWMHEAHHNIGYQNSVFQLVGHKCDLEKDRAILFEEGEYFAKYHGMKFIETSARAGTNVEEAFNLISRDIHAKLENGDFVLSDDWDGIKTGFTRRSSALSLLSMDENNSSCYNNC